MSSLFFNCDLKFNHRAFFVNLNDTYNVGDYVIKVTWWLNKLDMHFVLLDSSGLLFFVLCSLSRRPTIWFRFSTLFSTNRTPISCSMTSLDFRMRTKNSKGGGTRMNLLFGQTYNVAGYCTICHVVVLGCFFAVNIYNTNI